MWLCRHGKASSRGVLMASPRLRGLVHFPSSHWLVYRSLPPAPPAISEEKYSSVPSSLIDTSWMEYRSLLNGKGVTFHFFPSATAKYNPSVRRPSAPAFSEDVTNTICLSS